MFKFVGVLWKVLTNHHQAELIGGDTTVKGIAGASLLLCFNEAVGQNDVVASRKRDTFHRQRKGGDMEDCIGFAECNRGVVAASATGANIPLSETCVLNQISGFDLKAVYPYYCFCCKTNHCR